MEGVVTNLFPFSDTWNNMLVLFFVVDDVDEVHESVSSISEVSSLSTEQMKQRCHSWAISRIEWEYNVLWLVVILW